MNFRIAAKAFIVDNNKLLLIKRRPNAVHGPGKWDIPGGRLDPGENPYDGLTRETKEEINIAVNIICPLDIQHFTRDDGQKITMLVFLCRPNGNNIQLSEEHTEYKWAEMKELPHWLEKSLQNFNRIRL